jgi:hypothetical protein
MGVLKAKKLSDIEKQQVIENWHNHIISHENDGISREEIDRQYLEELRHYFSIRISRQTLYNWQDRFSPIAPPQTPAVTREVTAVCIKQHAIDAHAIFLAAVYDHQGAILASEWTPSFCRAFAKHHAITFTPATLKRWQRELQSKGAKS